MDNSKHPAEEAWERTLELAEEARRHADSRETWRALGPLHDICLGLNDEVRAAWCNLQMLGLDKRHWQQLGETVGGREGRALFIAERRIVDSKYVTEETFTEWADGEPTGFSENQMGVLGGSLRALEEPVPGHEEPADLSVLVGRDVYAKAQMNNLEQRRILRETQAIVRLLVSELESRARAELRSLRLAGPEYRFVVEQLTTLDSPVGDEVRAAIDSLPGTNPAEWAAAALTARTAAHKLGRHLWRRSDQTVRNAFGRSDIDLRTTGANDRSANKVLAYLAWHWARTDSEAERSSFRRLADNAMRLHPEGSRGKGGSGSIGLDGARAIVRDLFVLVSGLAHLTNLDPVTESGAPATSP